MSDPAVSPTPLISVPPTAPVSPDDNHEAFKRVFGGGKSVGSKPVEAKPRRGFKILAVMGGVLLVLILILGGIGVFTYSKVMSLKAKAEDVKSSGQAAYAALKGQDLVTAGAKLDEVKTKLDTLNSEYKTLAFVGGLPILNHYYQDGIHAFAAGYAGLNAGQVLIKTVEPYADVLGFKGQGSFTGGSAEDRIVKIIETLGKVTPALDTVSKDLDTVSVNLSAIDERRYPEEVRGTKIRSLIVQAKNLIAGAANTLTQAKPIIGVLPDVAGGTTRKKYLVIFQNSGELRPTGGFMTGYAIMNVDKGKFEAEASGDIYDLDAKFKNKPVIPAILKQFLTTESKFNLRDMNISPDFKVSMDTFYSNYEKVPGQPTNFDGIIGVDTHFLESLVKTLGPVDVPGFGTFSADNDPRCDCPQIIYSLSEIVDRPTNFIKVNRKGILGPMMKAILAKAYGAPKEKWPDLFTTGWANVTGKHIQLYFFDPKIQAAAEAVDAAGRVIAGPAGTDYLLIVDTNLAGAKSNFFVNQKVAHNIDLPENGVLKHTVTITYDNPFKPSNCNLEAGQLCLNGKLNDWVRFYLPPGATLVNSRGFDEGSVKQSDDLNHHVIEGVFQLQPLSRAKIELTYAIPYVNGKTYDIYFERQAGTENIQHEFTVNGEDHVVTLDKDQKFEFNF